MESVSLFAFPLAPVAHPNPVHTYLGHLRPLSSANDSFFMSVYIFTLVSQQQLEFNLIGLAGLPTMSGTALWRAFQRFCEGLGERINRMADHGRSIWVRGSNRESSQATSKK